MDATTRNGILHLLGDAMSDISEESYCAAWLSGWEYLLPELCRRALELQQTQIWGRCELSVETASTLSFMAERIGFWANADPDGPGYVAHSPFPIPIEVLV